MLLAVIIGGMGKGLSSLQHEIIRVLESAERPARAPSWCRHGEWIPRDIIEALGRENTASNRAVISRALSRLADRGFVGARHGQLCTQGRGYRYFLLKRPA